MKILQINKFHYPKGGADKYYLDLSGLLENNGHEVIHFAMQDKKNLPSPYGKYFISYVDFSRTRFNKEGLRAVGRMLYSLEAKKKIERLITAESPDIAHIHNIYHQLSPSILPALKKAGIPVVMTAHDYKLITPNYNMYHDGAVCEHSKVYKFWNTFVYKCVKDSYAASALAALEMFFHKLFKFYEKNIDVIVTPSQFMADKFVEYKQDKKKIKVVRNYVDFENFRVNNESKDYFVYFGRLSQEKGLEYLLEALKLAPSAKLKIVGAGPEEEKLKNKASNLLIERRVEFMGYKKEEELWQVVKNSLAVVLPSVWYENAPLSILEAQAFAKPVLGSKIGGIPELIEHGREGLLFKPADYREIAAQLQWSLANKEQLKEMGLRARKKIEENFTPQKHYQKIMAVYQKLLKK